MIPEDKVIEAIQDFTKDPTWNKIFYKAPPQAMERLAIAFYYANNLADQKDSQDQAVQDMINEYRALREEVEDSLEIEDLEYLAENMKEEKRPYYQKLLNDKRKKMEKEASKAGGDSVSAEEQQNN